MAVGVIDFIIDTHHRGDGIFRHGQPLGLDLEGGRQHYLFGARLQMTAQGAAGGIRRLGGIVEDASTVHHQTHIVVAPADILGITGLAQNGDRYAVDGHGAGLFIDILNHTTAAIAVEKIFQASVGAILLDHLNQIVQTLPHLASDVDDNLRKALARHVGPQAEFTDSAHTIDTELHCVPPNRMVRSSLSAWRPFATQEKEHHAVCPKTVRHALFFRRLGAFFSRGHQEP